MSNATSEFLGTRYLRQKATIELEDVQALFGGVRLTVTGTGKVQVEQVEKGGEVQQYRLYLRSSEVEKLWQQCIEDDLLTIEPEGRLGLPDEARPAVTLRNFRGEEHVVSKWAGVEDARFESVYRALRTLAARAKEPKLPPEPRPVWPKILQALAIVGLVVLAIAPIWPATLWARQIVDAAGIENPAGLVRPLLLLTAAVPVLIALLMFLELRAGRWRGFFWRNVSLLPFFVAVLYFIFLFTIPSYLIGAGLTRWGETAVAVIDAKRFTSGLDYTTDPPTPETTYTLQYTFQTDTNDTYTSRANVRRSYYDSITEGDEVTVYYLPRFPRFSRLEAAASAAGRAIFLFAALITMLTWLVGIGFFVHGIWPLALRRSGRVRRFSGR